MRAVALRVRSFVTGRWRSTAAVIAAVAIPVAVVLTLAAGAHRTATAATRYTDAAGGNVDTVLVQPSGRPVDAAVRALPEVRELEALTFVFALPANRSSAATLAGDGLGPLARLVAGRMPSPTVPGEFVATRSFLESNHAALGDHVPFVSYSQDQLDANRALVDPPAGPPIDGVVVGIITSPSEIDDPTPLALFSRGLLDEPVGIVTTSMVIRLTPGTSLDAFRHALDAVPGHEQFVFQPGLLVSTSSRNALQAQATGLTILAAVVAVAVVAAVALLLVRQLGSRTSERRPLLALGYTASQTTAEEVTWAAFVIVIGTVIGTVVATLASPLFPRGFARVLDPDAGRVLIDPTVLGVGAAVLAALLIACVAIGSLLAGRPSTVERQSATADAMARAGVGASTVTGVRHALSGGRGSRFAVGTMLATLTLAAMTVVGGVVFASSLRRLVHDPARFGVNFDLLVGNPTGTGATPELPSLDHEPGVDGVTLMANSGATANGRDVDLLGVDPLRGALLPRVLDGRSPASADEINVGAVTARELGVHIGDQLTLTGGSGASSTYRIVGTAVMTAPNSVGQGGGHGISMLLSGLNAIDPDATPAAMAIRLKPGATVPASLDGLQLTPALGTTPPADVVNLTRSQSVPIVLAVVVGVLAALTLAHILLTSLRRQRRDLAVLRAFGADRRWVRWAVHAQASTVALITLVVGVPLGIIAGRLVFRLFAERFGLVPDPTTPILLIVLTGAAFLAVANVIALMPARRASRAPVSTLLHAE
jgi:ABC-type lipoprotein release transport system permease subunit